MNDEVKQSRSIKMKPSIVRKAHLKAIGQGKMPGEGVEELIEGKIEREQKNLK